MTMPTSNDVFVDTSGWAYYLDRQDPLHSRFVVTVRNVVRQRRHLITTNYVITELVALLSNRYHFPRQQIIAAINTIKADPLVELIYVERSIDDMAWALLEARLDK